MQRRNLLLVGALASLVTASAALGQTATQPRGQKVLRMDGTLPLSQIVKDLEDKGYNRIAEIEFERGRYEVEGRREDGHWFKVYVDAHTGQIAEQ